MSSSFSMRNISESEEVNASSSMAAAERIPERMAAAERIPVSMAAAERKRSPQMMPTPEWIPEMMAAAERKRSPQMMATPERIPVSMAAAESEEVNASSSTASAESEEVSVRSRILVGETKRNTEAPHDIENQKDPFLEKSFRSLNLLSSSRCIYRVPKRLQQGNEKAYTPQVVSIGPFHHGEEHLKAMEEHKLRYLRDFLSRPRVCFCDLKQMIKNKEKILRGFYADSIKFDSEEFVRIVLVDAAFVIELLLSYYCQGKDDYILNNPRMLWDLRPDLRLLENQLPFFILQDLFNTLSSSPQLASFLKLSYHFFENKIDAKENEENLKKLSSSGEEVQHFVDLIRILYQPLKPEKKLKTRDAQHHSHTQRDRATPGWSRVSGRKRQQLI